MLYIEWRSLIWIYLCEQMNATRDFTKYVGTWKLKIWAKLELSEPGIG